MKLGALAALLLLQAGPVVQSGPPADPAHLRFERAVLPTAAGEVCAVLDGLVMAQSSSRTLEDLRLFDASGNEVAYALTESSSQPEPPAAARLLHVSARGGAVEFDLAMPPRPYSEIELRLNAHDFLASAHVTDASTGKDLGTFPLFDLTGQQLARSTALRLQEGTAPTLHVSLRLTTPAGAPWPVPASVVQGADVPASREAQTLYTPVLSAAEVHGSGPYTLATFQLPAHVPVERVRFTLDPQFRADFRRAVEIRSYTDGQPTPTDDIHGEIFRVNRSMPLSLKSAAIHEEHLALNAVLGANLRQGARVLVATYNDQQPPLPIRSVQLEMRERRLCFNAQAGMAYTLRYGDPALRSPVYEFARVFRADAPASPATLGPELLNRRFTPRTQESRYKDRHPDLLWIALLAGVTLLGAIALGSLKHQRRMQ